MSRSWWPTKPLQKFCLWDSHSNNELATTFVLAGEQSKQEEVEYLMARLAMSSFPHAYIPVLNFLNNFHGTQRSLKRRRRQLESCPALRATVVEEDGA